MFEDRLFFAREATPPFDFTIADGARDRESRASDEAMAALRLMRPADRFPRLA